VKQRKRFKESRQKNVNLIRKLSQRIANLMLRKGKELSIIFNAFDLFTQQNSNGILLTEREIHLQ
jgi:hypothetical protein